MPAGPLDFRVKIVSLLASGTELVCALDAGDLLVGRSHECDYPEWVTRLPVLSKPTFDVSGSSQSIDTLVREKIRARLPLYEVDDRRLIELAPDVLITQTHCEVCAVNPADIARGAAATLCRKQVVSLRAGTLAGILDGFMEVARVLAVEAKGTKLVADIRQRMADIRTKTLALPHPSVVCLEWLAPVFAMGNWGPELVDCAGGTNLLGAAGEHSASIDWDRVRKADAEFLVIAPCGFTIERTLGEMHVLRGNPGWHNLRAVRAGRVFVADGTLYFNRSGPLLFETAEILAEILHPEVFPPRHQGRCWRVYPQT